MKRLIFASAILLMTAAVCFSCSKTTPDNFGTLFGAITDYATGEPVSAANIVLSPGGKTAVTGSDGHYNFESLDPQQYTVTVQKSGYQTNRKTATVVAGESVQADLTLAVIQ